VGHAAEQKRFPARHVAVGLGRLVWIGFLQTENGFRGPAEAPGKFVYRHFEGAQVVNGRTATSFLVPTGWYCYHGSAQSTRHGKQFKGFERLKRALALVVHPRYFDALALPLEHNAYRTVTAPKFLANPHPFEFLEIHNSGLVRPSVVSARVDAARRWSAVHVFRFAHETKAVQLREIPG
jgi:hypothetical protein